MLTLILDFTFSFKNKITHNYETLDFVNTIIIVKSIFSL